MQRVRSACQQVENEFHLQRIIVEEFQRGGGHAEGGFEARRAPARASMVSYLSVIDAERVVSSDGFELRDAVEQHLPIDLSCAEPLDIEATTSVFEDLELAQIDPDMCGERVDLDGDGDLERSCVVERGEHVAGNTCTFVVDGSTLETLDGERRPVIFGGTITTRGSGDGLTYEIAVDRFSR